MSKLTLNRTLALCMLLVVLLWLPQCRAQAPAEQQTVLKTSRDFLRASYPELDGKNLPLSFQITQSVDKSWRRIPEIRFEITRFDRRSEGVLNPPFNSKTGKRYPTPENPILVQGYISFDDDGHLQQFSLGDSVLAHSQKNYAVRSLVESHKEWSESQALSALKKAGALYGPENRKEFLEAINLEEFHEFLGAFSVKSVEFVGLSEPHEGNFASLSWRIRLATQKTDGTNSDYVLIFEPFEGKLTQVLGVLPRPDALNVGSRD